MPHPFSCAIVCPPSPPRAADLDPFSDAFSFSRAHAAARRNAEAALALAQEGASRAQLVVVPEDIHGIRHFWRAIESPHILRRLAEPIPGPTTALAAAIAREREVHLVVTLYENEGQRLYNTTVLLGPRGRIVAAYRKIHLAPGEDWIVTPGDAFCVVDTDLGRLGIVCGEDYLFPETACIVARAGAEVVICPSRCPIPELILRARSLEARFATVFAHADGSLLIDETGRVLAQSAGRRGYVLETRFVPCEPDPDDRDELEALLTGIEDPRRRRSSLRRPDRYGALIDASWPEGKRVSPRRARKRSWEAYERLAARWERGPELLPPWER